MNWIDKLKKDDAGFVLVLAIVLMAGMAAVGIAVVTTATTDMMISRNSVESRNAFYLAETGREEAIGRLRILPGQTNHAGETWVERDERNANTDRTAGSYSGDSFTLADSPMAGTLSGDFEVTVDYAYEDLTTWCYSGADDPTAGVCEGTVVVLYCENFGLSGAGDTAVQGSCYSVEKPDIADPDTWLFTPTAGPVYKIESVGTTAGGSTAKVVSFIAVSGLNVEPPYGDIYTDGSIDVGGASGVDGSMCAMGGSSIGNPGSETCQEVEDAGGECVDDCPPTLTPLSDSEFDAYLGLSLDEIKSYADVKYDQTSNNQNYQTDESGKVWGTLCSNSTDTSNEDVHMCEENDAKLIFIDNVIEGAGPAGTDDVNNASLAGGEGRGILIVTGDLSISGNFFWEGVIFVGGELSGTGDITIVGTMMAHSTTDFNGSVVAFGSVEVANSVALGIAIPKALRWYRDRT